MLDPELERAMCERTLRAVEPLRAAGKLSSVLLQLTPAFDPRAHALQELEPLLAALEPAPVAIELRHRAWLRDPEQTNAAPAVLNQLSVRSARGRRRAGGERTVRPKGGAKPEIVPTRTVRLSAAAASASLLPASSRCGCCRPDP
jgi:uncharacterized protein YecE (DUF72 family)